LLESLVGIVFLVAAALIYLFISRQLFSRKTWQRLRPMCGSLILLLIAARWHVLATLRNPPYFAWTLQPRIPAVLSCEGTTPAVSQPQVSSGLQHSSTRLYFWLLHLLWLFPWSVYFPAIANLSFKPVDRAGQTRLLALCWAGLILIFFTFSTTQEYYSMSCYPALALLLGSA
jgi:4-amino-4-deoxy-L-arabinose transferase-like glycosyltransferase